jgi:hypothetical protein
VPRATAHGGPQPPVDEALERRVPEPEGEGRAVAVQRPAVGHGGGRRRLEQPAPARRRRRSARLLVELLEHPRDGEDERRPVAAQVLRDVLQAAAERELRAGVDGGQGDRPAAPGTSAGAVPASSQMWRTAAVRTDATSPAVAASPAKTATAPESSRIQATWSGDDVS